MSTVIDAPLAWPWCQDFSELGLPFSQACPPTPLSAPHWVAQNDTLRAALGLPESLWQSDQTLEVLAGNAWFEPRMPHATVYSGHQFGVWAGQLGDGRALSLGAISTPIGPQELQLKGAGPTPYSRMGDGRAVLRSSIREYLASVAMHGLSIPTTHALCVIGSPTPVRREVMESAAVVTRVAPSFVRFGHFEHFSARNDVDALRALADHVITQHVLALQSLEGPVRYASLLRWVTERTADLMSHWQSVGFCHGVMNTDNMSILGLTLDYGPFQFMDAFSAHHICNHSDHQGRYAYNRQPQIAYWNLFCLAQALMPLIEDQAQALAALETFKQRFSDGLTQHMLAKLGLTGVQTGDGELIDDVLHALHDNQVDYTVFWRRLSHAVSESARLATAFEPVRDLFLHREVFDAWLLRYLARLGDVARSDQGQTMLRVNPKYVLRNHLGELAIRLAKEGDFSMVQDLCRVLQNPYDEHPEHEEWSGLAPEWATSIEISCSS